MGTLKETKKMMRNDPELCSMLVRSTRRNLLVDLDGDGIADIALMDDNHDGDIDMIAVDVTGNGDFNFYVGDADANGIIDTVECYTDYDDMPIASYHGRAVEERFVVISNAIYSHIAAAEIIGNALADTFTEFVDLAVREYNRILRAEGAVSTEPPAEGAEKAEA